MEEDWNDILKILTTQSTPAKNTNPKLGLHHRLDLLQSLYKHNLCRRLINKIVHGDGLNVLKAVSQDHQNDKKFDKIVYVVNVKDDQLIMASFMKLLCRITKTESRNIFKHDNIDSNEGQNNNGTSNSKGTNNPSNRILQLVDSLSHLYHKHAMPCGCAHKTHHYHSLWTRRFFKLLTHTCHAIRDYVTTGCDLEEEKEEGMRRFREFSAFQLKKIIRGGGGRNVDVASEFLRPTGFNHFIGFGNIGDEFL